MPITANKVTIRESTGAQSVTIIDLTPTTAGTTSVEKDKIFFSAAGIQTKGIVDFDTGINNTTLRVTENGTYSPEGEYTGYDPVIVAVPEINNKEGAIFEENNKTYPIPDGYSGYGEITVQVPTIEIKNKVDTFTENNKTYSIPSGYTGYGEITVSVPVGDSVKSINSETEMDAALGAATAGQVYKYTGETGRYEKDSYYVVE